MERTFTFLQWHEITDLMYWLESSGGLIVGAAALSFFSRIEMPDLMVDIVVEWTKAQDIITFLLSINFSTQCQRPRTLQDGVGDEFPYLVGDEMGQYPLVHIVEFGRATGGWVRVIITDCAPLAIVLSMKSSECEVRACPIC